LSKGGRGINNFKSLFFSPFLFSPTLLENKGGEKKVAGRRGAPVGATRFASLLATESKCFFAGE
jgi:hypothetical protein